MFGHTPPRIRPHTSSKASEQATRYRTTQTRINHSSPAFRRSNAHIHPLPFPPQPSFLAQKITQLQRRKQRMMQFREYGRAQQIDQRIRRARSQLADIRMTQLVNQQQEERRSVSEAHKHQMRYLHQEWNFYFQKLKERESLILQSFKEEQQKQVSLAQERLQRRCRSLHSSSREIKDLKREEQRLKKFQQFGHLKFVKIQLAEAIFKERRKRAKILESYAEYEEERLCVTQSKKYEVLVGRLEEYRRDKQRMYLREQKRLKQKYKNVMQQLKHDQTMELSQTSKMTLLMTN